MAFLQVTSLTCSQPWYLAALALMFCYAAVLSIPCSGAGESVVLSMDRRFLAFDALPKSASGESLRLELKRLPSSHKDRYHTLRMAMEKDEARRRRLEQQVLTRLEDKVHTQSAVQTGSNGSSASSGDVPLEASLNVISGSSVGSGEYFVSMSIGTPPQKLFLIADTGSDLTWVKCGRLTGLSGEGELVTNRSFDDSISSTFTPLSCSSSQCAAWFFQPTCAGLPGHCKFSYSYSDQSFIRGLLGFELITLGENQQVNLAMGCGHQYTGANFEKAGGVVGLGQGPLSLSSQLTAQAAYAKKFSYCLADFFGSTSISGSLAFGDTLLQAQSLQYTPLLQNPYAETYYYVRVQGVKVGGIMLDIPADVWEIDGRGNGGAVVDSGSTLAQFAQPAYVAIREAFREAIQETPMDADAITGLDLCYKTSTQSAQIVLPEFAVVFDGGLVLEPPHENYFTEAAPGITCLAMQEVSPGGFSIIGNLLQQNFHVEFDRLHNRLGVAPTDCSKLH